MCVYGYDENSASCLKTMNPIFNVNKYILEVVSPSPLPFKRPLYLRLNY